MKAIARVALATFVMFFALDAAARVVFTVWDDLAANGDQTEPDGWFRYSPVLGWENRPGFQGEAYYAERKFDANGFFARDSEQATHADSNTVVFVGDSNTFGYAVPASETFVELTEDLLPGVDAVNLGVSGYSSYQGRKRLEQYLKSHHPGAIVVSFNFNDRRREFSRVGDSRRFGEVYESVSSPFRGISDALHHVYVYRAVEAAARRTGLIEPPPDARHDPADALRPRVSPREYRENLMAMAEEAGQAGVPVLFMLLRDNPLQTRPIYLGIEKLRERDYDAALEYFERVVRDDNMHSLLARSYLARTYRAMGREADAEEALRAGEAWISLHGGRLVRLDRDYNNLMRQVAGEYGAPVVDAAAALEQDPYVFLDDCHFDEAGHRRVAETLAPELVELLSHS